MPEKGQCTVYPHWICTTRGPPSVAQVGQGAPCLPRSQFQADSLWPGMGSGRAFKAVPEAKGYGIC